MSASNVGRRASIGSGTDDVFWERFDSVVGQNLPERIVFCLDIHEDMGNNLPATSPDSISNPVTTRMDSAKKAIRIFVNTKRTFSRRHKFSLCVLRDTAEILNDDRRDILEIL
eukprot:124473_1